MLFFPFYPALMLAFESHNVIDLRLRKIATGGIHAGDESRLMLTEKIDAAVEVGAMLIAGKSSGEIVDFYRMRVAANAARLIIKA